MSYNLGVAALLAGRPSLSLGPVSESNHLLVVHYSSFSDSTFETPSSVMVTP